MGSKFISWLTAHRNRTRFVTPSHVALLVNDRWVFESTMDAGVRVISKDKWQLKNTVAHLYDLGAWEYQEVADYFRAIKGKPYDYLGALFLGLCLFINKVLRIPLPKQNYWHSEDKFFCSEVVSKMLRINGDMTSPADILSLCEGKDSKE
ncbi:MAG: hypothetical protein QXT45_05445 [Candidatus Bilamarchaeaceae archaeon]